MSRILSPEGRIRTPFGDQESVGRDAESHVVVKASPASSFIVIEAKFLLELLIVALDPPAHFGGYDEPLKVGIGPKGRKPIFGRRAVALRPFGFVDAFAACNTSREKSADSDLASCPVDRGERRSAGLRARWRPTARPRPDNCPACQAGRNIAGRRRPNEFLLGKSRAVDDPGAYPAALLDSGNNNGSNPPQ